MLLGLGRIGCGYDSDLPFLPDEPLSSARILTHARALVCHPGYVLTAGIDPNPEARQRFENLYGIKTFPDLAAWSNDTVDCGLDLAVVAVGPEHQKVLVESLCLLAAPRMLLLEKPVSISLEESRALKAYCSNKNDLKVAVNYIRRYLPAVKEWQSRLMSGELGTLIYGQITYGKGLLSNASHFVNLAEAWLGPLKFGHLIDKGSACLGFDWEASLELLASHHDDASLLVRSVGSSGMRAGELDLWFTGGRLSWQNNGEFIAFWPRRTPVKYATGEIDSHDCLTAEPELTPTGIDQYQMEVMSELHLSLLDPTRSPLICSLKEGLHTIETLLSAYTDNTGTKKSISSD